MVPPWCVCSIHYEEHAKMLVKPAYAPVVHFVGLEIQLKVLAHPDSRGH